MDRVPRLSSPTSTTQCSSATGCPENDEPPPMSRSMAVATSGSPCPAQDQSTAASPGPACMTIHDRPAPETHYFAAYSARHVRQDLAARDRDGSLASATGAAATALPSCAAPSQRRVSATSSGHHAELRVAQEERARSRRSVCCGRSAGRPSESCGTGIMRLVRVTGSRQCRLRCSIAAARASRTARYCGLLTDSGASSLAAGV